jgi:energy-coupling factor transporter ATP-binding protein EcfA2
MGRRHSDIERSNLNWFANDNSVATLCCINIKKGQIRGLKRLRVDFNYPITAIAGKNGCGKSTIITLAACAFHNRDDAWKLPDRIRPYYTFSDFFLQARGESAIDDVEVLFQIHYDNWRPTPRKPDGKGLGWQSRKKKKGGRWTDYDARPDRAVAFLGIERLVPSAEKSVFRSYRQHFSSRERSGFEEAVCLAVSQVLSVPYDTFEFREYGKYRLPWVQRKRGVGYSGFNMGAGEKALFEFFAALLSAPRGALFLVDEIELGLHEEAQRALIRVLNNTCNERHTQIIVTTHSPVVLEALPPEGRLYLDHSANGANIVPGISPEFATGRLGGKNSCELTIYVEDASAAELVRTALSGAVRGRVNIVSIGSHTAVLNALCTRFKDKSLGKVIGFLDGEQRIAERGHVKKFNGLAEGHPEAAIWISEKLGFLPGDVSPEAYVFGMLRELGAGVLEKGFGFDGEVILDAIDCALVAGDHSELNMIARTIFKSESQVWSDACRLIVQEMPSSVDGIRQLVDSTLT